MHIISDHELEVLDLLSLKACFVQVLPRDLSGEDLASHEVSSHKHKLHLVQDKVNLLHCLQ